MKEGKFLADEIKLTRVHGYELIVSVDEYRTASRGIYTSYALACKDAVGAGWYGSMGTVEPVRNVFRDDEYNLYTLKESGKFVDVERSERAEMLASIKSKLSESEIKFLGIQEDKTE